MKNSYTALDLVLPKLILYLGRVQIASSAELVCHWRIGEVKVIRISIIVPPIYKSKRDKLKMYAFILI